MSITITHQTYVSRSQRLAGAKPLILEGPTTINAPLDSGSQRVTPGLAAAQVVLPDGTTKADFAFWSVSGAIEGAYFSTEADQSNQRFTATPMSDLKMIAWYFVEGAGSGESGVTIDAFDLTLGEFLNDSFVTVNPDAALALTANSGGDISSTRAENIVANDFVDTAFFSRWQVIRGSEATNNKVLEVAKASSGKVIALYRTPQFVPLKLPDTPIYILWGIRDGSLDGVILIKGVPFHVHIGDPIFRQFVTGLNLAIMSHDTEGELRKTLHDASLQQVMAALNHYNEGKKAS